MTGVEVMSSQGMTFGDIVTQFGFAGLIFIAFMFLLKWVLKQQDKILDTAKEERLAHLAQMATFQKALDEHTINAREFHKTVTDAHLYQREEHKEIINNLGKICFNTEKNTQCLSKISDNLDEQKTILLRINGYKHD